MNSYRQRVIISLLFTLEVLTSIIHEVDKCHLRLTVRRQTSRP